MRHPLLLLAFAATALPAQQNAASPANATTPLAQYTSVKVAVVPVQFYRGDTAFVRQPAMAMRAAFDSLVSEAMEEHGLKGTWATPADVSRAAKRNAMYASDPHNLGAFPMRNGAGKDGMVPDPLAANLRRLVALHDARYALMPVELRVQTDGAGGRLSVRVLLVDARLMKALFQVDLAGDGAAAYSPELLRQLATRVVELAVAP